MNSLPWTDREIARALSLYADGLPCAEIADAVGRSETALRLKLLKLGFSSRRVIVEEPAAAPSRKAAGPVVVWNAGCVRRIGVSGKPATSGPSCSALWYAPEGIVGVRKGG